MQNGISKYVSYIPLSELAEERRVTMAQMQTFCTRLKIRPHPLYGCSPAQWKKLDWYFYNRLGKYAGQPLTA